MKLKPIKLSIILGVIAFSIVSGCKTTTQTPVETNEWIAIPLPQNILAEATWELKENNSDNFNYTGKNNEFYNQWYDNHISGWRGSGATYFSNDHSDVDNGYLVLNATSVPAHKQGKTINYGEFESKKTIYTGFVTAKSHIEYPVYVEASLKISHLGLANNFWMLSDDDRNEIDVTETYGDTVKSSYHMSSNYHIFKRSPETNEMLGDYGHKQGFHETSDKAVFNEGFHRFGFYWKSPTYMEFYLDGEHVRTLSTSDVLEDPEGKFMDRPMRIIFDMEDHVWRTRKGITPDLAELNDKNKNRMLVVWMRTYKPIHLK